GEDGAVGIVPVADIAVDEGLERAALEGAGETVRSHGSPLVLGDVDDGVEVDPPGPDEGQRGQGPGEEAGGGGREHEPDQDQHDDDLGDAAHEYDPLSGLVG